MNRFRATRSDAKTKSDAKWRDHAALRHFAASPGGALFIDDTPGHVAVAEALGMAGHLHTSTASTISRIEGFLAA